MRLLPAAIQIGCRVLTPVRDLHPVMQQASYRISSMVELYSATCSFVFRLHQYTVIKIYGTVSYMTYNFNGI